MMALMTGPKLSIMVRNNQYRLIMIHIDEVEQNMPLVNYFKWLMRFNTLNQSRIMLLSGGLTTKIKQLAWAQDRTVKVQQLQKLTQHMPLMFGCYFWFGMVAHTPLSGK